MTTLKIKDPIGDVKIYHENAMFSTDGRSHSRGDIEGLIKEFSGKSGYNILIR